MQIIIAHAITTSTARASSVSTSSYTNTIFNQSARVRLYYDCFLKDKHEAWDRDIIPQVPQALWSSSTWHCVTALSL